VFMLNVAFGSRGYNAGDWMRTLRWSFVRAGDVFSVTTLGVMQGLNHN